jgi:hypothetical protein
MSSSPIGKKSIAIRTSKVAQLLIVKVSLINRLVMQIVVEAVVEGVMVY